MSYHNYTPIGEHVEPIDTWEPSKKAPDSKLTYIDLSSVNKDTKKIENLQTIVGKDAPSRARQIVKKDDVLVATVRPNLNGVSIVSEDYPNATASTGYCVLRPKKTLHPRYLFYWTTSKYFVEDMTKKATGASYPAVSDKIIKQSLIPLPPFPVQRKIAAILDAADALRQKDRLLLKKYEELGQAVFLEMFTGGGKYVTLGSVCKLNPKKSETNNIDRSIEVSFVPMSRVSETGDLDLSESRSLDSSWNGFTYFREGDVLFAKITPCMENGKGAIASGLKNGIGFGSTEFHVLRPLEGMTTSTWLYYLTASKQFRQEAEKNMTGSAGQKRVPADFLNQYNVQLPSIETQHKFEAKIKAIDAQKKLVAASLQKSEELFGSLLEGVLGNQQPISDNLKVLV